MVFFNVSEREKVFVTFEITKKLGDKNLIFRNSLTILKGL